MEMILSSENFISENSYKTRHKRGWIDDFKGLKRELNLNCLVMMKFEANDWKIVSYYYYLQKYKLIITCKLDPAYKK